MIADFCTKPLQREVFRRLKAVSMGHVDLETFMASMADTPEECVGDNGIDVTEQEAEMPVDGIDKMPMSVNGAHDNDVVKGHNLSQWPVSYANIVRGDRVKTSSKVDHL